MKLALVTPEDGTEPRPAIRDGDQFVVGPADGLTIGDFLELSVNNGPTSVRDALRGDNGTERRYDEDELNVQAPMDPDGRLFYMGGTYTSHLRERNRTLFVTPHLWLAPDTSIVGPGDSIRIPKAVSEHAMPAVELCAVLGKGGSYIDEEAAYNHIGGYTISNDVTARTDWPGPRGYKIMDTFSPLGPHVVTADEIADPMDLSMEIRQNAERICIGSTAGHRFTLSFLVSYLSTMYELRPGDVISTGDPAGVSDRLRPGGTVELEIEDVGVLANDVIEETV
jgi:2-keto-4-pentenoate hydratase/2-oxohepta-3-ene-1,7-dioic acid hydratase in catechol pathway